jgi:RimJ/RimL family protein N-acetyltransferase
MRWQSPVPNEAIEFEASDVGELGNHTRATLESHFLALSPHDRRLRFGATLSETAITGYVQGIDFQRDAVFGVIAPEGLVGVAHLAMGGDVAELGISVLPQARGRGAGQRLFCRGTEHARERGLRRLLMHCLADNAAMMHIARRSGMSVVVAAGDADAYLELEALRSPQTLFPGSLQGVRGGSEGGRPRTV